MRLILNRESGDPLFKQIAHQLRELIRDGSLPAGTRLTAIRRLAKDLAVNRITVESAYDLLKAEGLIDSHPGSGTYILDNQNILPDQFETPVANPAGTISPYAGSISPDENGSAIINLGAGAGDHSLFPVESFRKALNQVLRRDGQTAMDYGPPGGYPPLKKAIASILANQGLNCHPDHILITAGSQQAILLTALYLLKPGDTILVEAPTYAGALDLFRSLNLKIIGIPIDQKGMRTDLLEKAIRKYSPKLIYTVPTFNNPTGTCLSGSRRRKLAHLAEKYNILVLEDDFVGDLRYDGHSSPPIKAFEENGHNIIYVSTFSKMLMPGLRVGFLAASARFIGPLSEIKRINDLATSNLNQRALAEYIHIGRYRKFLRRSISLYRRRRDLMLQLIKDEIPEDYEIFHISQGGFFFWMQLPARLSATAIQQTAFSRGVSIETGEAYFPELIIGRPNQQGGFLRLNFASNTEFEIIQGIKILGNILKNQ